MKTKTDLIFVATSKAIDHAAKYGSNNKCFMHLNSDCGKMRQGRNALGKTVNPVPDQLVDLFPVCPSCLDKAAPAVKREVNLMLIERERLKGQGKLPLVGTAPKRNRKRKGVELPPPKITPKTPPPVESLNVNGVEYVRRFDYDRLQASINNAAGMLIKIRRITKTESLTDAKFETWEFQETVTSKELNLSAGDFIRVLKVNPNG